MLLHRRTPLASPHRRDFPLIVVVALSFAVSLFPAVVTSQTAGSLAQVDRQVSNLAPGHNLLVAEFTGNRCASIHEVSADTELAIASTFKLYVLGELARQVQQGDVRWDEPITLRSELRSMPSGDYAWHPVGSQVSVLDLARAMMRYSDNTATDHLIHHLGRENIERAFAAFGHANPSVNVPLLMTRELFLIKMRESDTWMTQYMASTNTEQLAMLQRDVSTAPLDPNGGWGNWNGPTAIAGIEWFASASDLCRVAVALWTLGAYPGMEPVRDIMTGNRGGIENTLIWPDVGFKNGYEAGVVNATWVLERRDGRVFFVSAGLNHPSGVVNDWNLRSSLAPVFDCLATLRDLDDCGG